MATARDLIEQSLRLINEPGRGVSISSADANDALSSINNMLSSWSADSLIIPSKTTESITLTAGQSSYTWGSGGDITTTRPLYLESARTTDNNYDYPIRMIDENEYNGISYKSSSQRPERAYYEPNYSLGNLYFDNSPNKAYTVTITSMKAISEIAALTTTVDLPNEYKQAVVFNAAVLLAPEYEKEASATVQREAIRSLNSIKRLNARSRVQRLRVDKALLANNQYYNINTD